jgi:hypothetical protein
MHWQPKTLLSVRAARGVVFSTFWAVTAISAATPVNPLMHTAN